MIKHSKIKMLKEKRMDSTKVKSDSLRIAKPDSVAKPNLLNNAF